MSRITLKRDEKVRPTNVYKHSVSICNVTFHSLSIYTLISLTYLSLINSKSLKNPLPMANVLDVPRYSIGFMYRDTQNHQRLHASLTHNAHSFIKHV